MNFIYKNYNYLLNEFNQPWLSRKKLEEYSIAIHNKGAPLMNCFGFEDGTVCPCSKPGQNQRIFFNPNKAGLFASYFKKNLTNINITLCNF